VRKRLRAGAMKSGVHNQYLSNASPFQIRKIEEYYPIVPSIEELSLVPILLEEEVEEYSEESNTVTTRRLEFCFSRTFEPEFVDTCCRMSYFPMSLLYFGTVHVMAIKLHNQRCIANLEKEFHVGKSGKQRYQKVPFSHTIILLSYYSIILSFYYPILLSYYSIVLFLHLIFKV
jgi:hypothetical protein